MEGTPSPSDVMSRLQAIIDHNESNLIRARHER